jgi:16S rRNA (cytidine1402-2'-O)-methyltransferase
MPTLYLVPTPLGDPDDITLRALRILREASAVAAEDARPAQVLLHHHNLLTPIIGYADALDALNGGDVALVAVSGTPGIGDPAQAIVHEAITRGVRVEPLPGASEAITALVLSGLPTDAFVYVGALPDDLSAYAHERETMIFAVSNNDPRAAIKRLYAAFGDRRICLCARLTQADENIYRGMLSDALEYNLVSSHEPIMIVVAGAPPEAAETWDEARVRAVLRERLASGEALKAAAKTVAKAAGWDRRAVYALGVDEKRNTP